MPDQATKLAAEQAELEAVLASGIFARAPSLAQLLSYICNKHFAGEHHLIKEYNIAVEALGRPADFDQKKDSIVRVEAHRLRKRLRQYYEGEGSSHEVQIDLPLGGYTPVFLNRSASVASEDLAHELPSNLSAAIPPPPAQNPLPRRFAVAAASLLVLAVLIIVGVYARRTPPQQQPASAPQPVDLSTAANVSEIRINAGASSAIADNEGHTWVADRYFKGGTASSSPNLVANGTLYPVVFQTWRQGDFSYRIPLKPGVYELTLWFCEPTAINTNSDSRTFQVSINGTVAAQDLDILAESAYPHTVFGRTWKDVAPAEDGFLTLEFRPGNAPAIVSAIQVIAGTPNRLRPIRIAAREEPYTDSQGRLWSSDRHFIGGRLVKRIEAIHNTDDPDLYRGERYGRFSYAIPVPPDSTYTAVVHFAETWFGGTGSGGTGSRLFDILCNGLLLQSNVDVFHESKGAFTAGTKTYRGLKPTPNGKLILQFVPSRNYAFINALEILDEAPTDKANTKR